MDTIGLLLIAINVIISLKGFNDRAFFDKYKFQIAPIQRGEKLRLFSSGFLHVDYMHLFLNMYVLYVFAPSILNNVGVFKFLLIYFGSLLAGNGLTLMYHKNNPYYSAVGASGAIAGVIYGAILLNPTMRLGIFPLPFYVPGYLFGILYIGYSIYGMKKQLGNIGHSAHLGGAIGGYLATILLQSSVVSYNTNTVLILGAVTVVAFFILRAKDKK
ncbi:MAG: rhomboid family intramembrane serine protease [Flavobacteriaceae bacterium]|nr:rhomboid family intramembrane serine protease [Flavobacteriaceae bacterium]